MMLIPRFLRVVGSSEPNNGKIFQISSKRCSIVNPTREGEFLSCGDSDRVDSEFTLSMEVDQSQQGPSTPHKCLANECREFTLLISPIHALVLQSTPHSCVGTN
mmetsp:Transcript_7127/g.26690  ORF Transcript_7127/g.26690 Transcript_7127/m.26690 type:complete len:104 (-) Transcript_7127:2099-2410(-)